MINLNILYGFLFTFIAGFSTMLGVLALFLKKRENILVKSLALASGVVFSVSILDLIPESINLISSKYNIIPTILFSLIFIMIGILLSSYLNYKIPTSEKSGGLYKIGIFSMIAIIIHNIPEGIATFLATGKDLRLGLTLMIAIALHNIPEGISISVPIYYSNNSKFKAILYTFISAISEPFGALLTYLFLRRGVEDSIMGYIFSIIAGIMIYISINELLKESFKYNKKKITIIYFIIGILIMYVSLLLLN